MVDVVTTLDDLDQATRATTKRRFGVGRRTFEIDLGDENAARFDREMDFWIKHARKVEQAQESARGGPRHAVGETVYPVPAKGAKWWSDPPRPFSAQTGEAHRDARRRLRELGAPGNGTIPQLIGDRFVDEVWTPSGATSWEDFLRIESEAAASRNGKPAGKPRPRKQTANAR